MGDTTELTTRIENRYNELAESSCCLSCGGAVDLAVPQKGEVCVDLGSGRGRDVLRLAQEVGPEGFAHGIDTAEKMLVRARREAEKLGIENALFHDAELHSTGLADGSVDLVISNCTINHAPDKDAVWAEIFRILKAGGRFVVSDIYSTADVPTEYRDDPDAVAECWAGAVTRDEYLDTLRRTGFEAVQILEESAPYEKGAIQVASVTMAGLRPRPRSCCGS